MPHILPMTRRSGREFMELKISTYLPQPSMHANTNDQTTATWFAISIICSIYHPSINVYHSRYGRRAVPV